MGLFEANDTIGHGLTRQLEVMLEKFGLASKLLCYVKDEETNLGTVTITLESVILCEAFKLLAPFYGPCFGHVMNKTTQYATNDDMVSKDY
jgi:hypothetical protein